MVSGNEKLIRATPSTTIKPEVISCFWKGFFVRRGSKIDVKVAGNGKGKITIPFHSEEDFNRIIKLIKG